MRRWVDSVPILEPEELEALRIEEVSIRKGELLSLPLTAANVARRQQWCGRPRRFQDDHLYHREDERWLPQWFAAREIAWRRRKEHTEPIWCVVANVVREHAFGPGGVHTRIGTKMLRGGSRVSIIDAYFGMCEHVIVIARFRGNCARRSLGEEDPM